MDDIFSCSHAVSSAYADEINRCVFFLTNHKSNQKNLRPFVKYPKHEQSKKKQKKKRRLATRITFNIVTFGRDKRCEKPGLDFKPFVRLNYSLKLNFSRSRRVLIVSKVFKNFEFEKKRTGISILTLESILGVQLNQANSTRSRTHLRPSSKYGFLLVGKKRSRGIILNEKSYI